MLRILTWNIQAFQSSPVSHIARRLLHWNPDVICLQEDVLGVRWPREFRSLYQCTTLCHGEQMQDERSLLTNSIWVKRDPHITLGVPPALDTTCHCPVSRCACGIHINGLTIVNTHLCGGRFDDAHFASVPDDRLPLLVDSKRCALQKILNEYDPDVVVGDMNAPASADEVLDRIKTSHIYRYLSRPRRRAYIHFLMSVGSTLHQHGLSPLYTAQELAGSSSVYGGVVDWVWSKQRIPGELLGLRYGLDLSDHNAILVEVKSQNQPQ